MSMSPGSELRNTAIPENSEMDSTNGNGHHEELHEHYKLFLALPNRRHRTLSESERIASSPNFKGTVVSFCRNKGHGFVKPEDGTESLFVHISDIEGEWCPKEGDIVSFKKALMPPKMQNYQAVHVQFIHLKDGVKHEHWETVPPVHTNHGEADKCV